ncbi:unnamed protein product [Bemisia tabaci]|uniref:Uncharacterized protein n=1 Tax=Bemisia tabaci TaxID=7038 RepID=A0A9P0EXV5_BEMTA|nr:unnamed protein product [Bemisia tabaci]
MSRRIKCMLIIIFITNAFVWAIHRTRPAYSHSRSGRRRWRQPETLPPKAPPERNLVDIQSSRRRRSPETMTHESLPEVNLDDIESNYSFGEVVPDVSHVPHKKKECESYGYLTRHGSSTKIPLKVPYRTKDFNFNPRIRCKWSNAAERLMTLSKADPERFYSLYSRSVTAAKVYLYVFGLQILSPDEANEDPKKMPNHLLNPPLHWKALSVSKSTISKVGSTLTKATATRLIQKLARTTSKIFSSSASSSSSSKRNTEKYG